MPRNMSVPLLNSFNNFVSNTGITSFAFPANLPEVTDMSIVLSGCKSLASITFWETAPKITTIAHLLVDCHVLSGDIVVPAIPTNTSLLYTFLRCKSLRKITFTGSMPNTTHYQDTFKECYALQEITHPINGGYATYSMYGSNPMLKKVKVTNLLTYVASSPQFATSVPSLEHSYGDADNSIVAIGQSMAISNYTANLRIFDHPKFRASRFLAGDATAKLLNLETCNIDWANSLFGDVNVPQLRISANFDVTWLNSMMTLLRTVTASQVCDIGYCPGYQASDHTIATAKGWVVKGYPKIGNGYVDTIAKTTAVFHGNLILTGWNPTTTLITVGICYALVPNPNTSGSVRNVSSATLGPITVNMTSLTANKTYYCKAYATSTYGTTYGQEFSFTTLP